MTLSIPAALLLIAASVWAQPNPFYGYQPLGQVKDFLKLSDSQLQTILTNNDDYNRWSSEKQTRIRQVQSEIADETAKDTLDPNALGIRYAEVETICREMKNQATAYQKKNTDALTDPQKSKLKVLEDAIKLAPVISEAQYGNLIGGFTSTPYAFTSSSTGIGGIIGPVGGCYSPFPTAVVRTGDFTSAPMNGNVIPANRVSGAVPMNRWFNTNGFNRIPGDEPSIRSMPGPQKQDRVSGRSQK
jgi:hypothetical protein